MLWDQISDIVPFVRGGEHARKNTALRQMPWETFIAPIIPGMWRLKIMTLTRLNGHIEASSNAAFKANILLRYQG